VPRASSSRTPPAPSGAGNYARIYAVVKQVPRGRVATYGQIARLAGLPGHARQVGYAMAALKPGVRVPWHRVINAQGRVSPRRAGPGAGVRQRQLLEKEGVEFSPSGAVALNVYGWEPRAPRRRRVS
jgi:methylated-DNA-protein-cysteine methyltransferase-like protein